MDEKVEVIYNGFLEKGLISNQTDLNTFSQANEDQLQTLYNTGVENKVISNETSFDTFKAAWDLKKKGESLGTGEEGSMVSTTLDETPSGSLDSGEPLLDFPQEGYREIIDEITGKPIDIYKDNPLNDTREATKFSQAYINASPEYQKYQERLKNRQRVIQGREDLKLEQEQERILKEREQQLSKYVDSKISKLPIDRQREILNYKYSKEDEAQLTPEQIAKNIEESKSSFIKSFLEDLKDREDPELTLETTEEKELKKAKKEEEKKAILEDEGFKAIMKDNTAFEEVADKSAEEQQRFINNNFGKYNFLSQEGAFGRMYVYDGDLNEQEVDFSTPEGIEEFKTFIKERASKPKSRFSEEEANSPAYRKAIEYFNNQGLNYDFVRSAYDNSQDDYKKLALIEKFIGAEDADAEDLKEINPLNSVLGVGFSPLDTEAFPELFSINRRGEIVPTSSKKLKEEREKIQDRLDRYQTAVGAKTLMANNRDKIEEFDKQLDEASKISARQAIDLSNEISKEFESIQAESQNYFGMPLEEVDYKNLRLPIEQETFVNLATRAAEAQNSYEDAAKEYQNASTYWDMKLNKAISKESAENLEGFTQTWNRNWLRGEAGLVLTYLGLGLNPLDIPDTPENISKAIAGYLKEAAETPTSITDARRQQQGYGIVPRGTSNQMFGAELYDFVRNPGDYFANLLANSVAQMLPVGYKFILGGAGAGFGAGLSTGAIAGPKGALLSGAIGAARGAYVAQALTNVAVEYFNAIIEKAEEKGYNTTIPEQWMQAVQDPDVMIAGRNVGLLRGGIIAGVDLATMGLYGKVIGPSAKFATASNKAARYASGLGVMAASEGLGEYLAQKGRIAFIGDKEKVDWNEVIYEMSGALAMGVSNPIEIANVGSNIYQSVSVNKKKKLAQNLTDIRNVVKEKASGTKILEWANHMYKQGHIDQTTLGQIESNLAAKRAADEAIASSNPDLIVKEETKTKLEGEEKAPGIVSRAMNMFKSNKVRDRVATLYRVRGLLETNEDTKMVNKEKISQINQEISEIVNTGKLKTEGAFVIDQGINRQIGGQFYSIKGKRYTPDAFASYVQKLTPEEFAKIEKDITTPPLEQMDVSIQEQIKTKRDAIQKQSTEGMDVGEQSTDGQEVGEGDTQGEQVTTETKEEVQVETQEEDDQEVEDTEEAKTEAKELADEFGVKIEPENLKTHEESKQEIVDKFEDNDTKVKVEVEEEGKVTKYSINRANRRGYLSQLPKLGVAKTEKGVSFFIEDNKGRKIVISPQIVRDIVSGKATNLTLSKFVADAQKSGKKFNYNVNMSSTQQYKDLVEMIKILGGTVQQDYMINISSLFSENARKFVALMKNAFKINDLFVISFKDVNKRTPLFLSLPIKQQNAIKKYVTTYRDSVLGVYVDGVVLVNPDHPQAEGDLNLLSLLAHEIGHHLEKKLLDTTNKNVYEGIYAEYEAWHEKKYGGKPGGKLAPIDKRSTIANVVIDAINNLLVGEIFRTKGTKRVPRGDVSDGRKLDKRRSFDVYLTSFEEYFADQVQRFMFEDEKATTEIEKFFKEIADIIKRSYRLLEEFFANQPPGKRTLDQFLKRAEAPKLREFLRNHFKPTEKTDQETRLLREDEIKELFEELDFKETKQQPSKKKKGKEPLNRDKIIDVASTISPKEFIDKARALGYNDPSIKIVLRKIYTNLTGVEVNQLLKSPTKYTLLDKSKRGRSILLPKSFRNIIGGITNGIVLFEDLVSEINKYSTAKERTPQQMMDFALKTLKEHSIYKEQEGNTALQRQMELDIARLMKPVNLEPTLSNKIENIKDNIKNLKQGAKDIKKAQAKLATLVRQHVDSKFFTKAQFNKAISLIQKITLDNYDAQFAELVALVDEVNEIKRVSQLKKLKTLFKKLSKVKKTPSGKPKSAGFVDAVGVQFFKEASKTLNILLEAFSPKPDIAKEGKKKLDALKKKFFQVSEDGQILEYALKPEVLKVLEAYDQNPDNLTDLTNNERITLAEYSAYSYLKNIMELPYDSLVEYIKDQTIDEFGKTLKDFQTSRRILLKQSIITRANRNRVLQSQMSQSQQAIFGNALFDVDENGNLVYEFRKPTAEETTRLITEEMAKQATDNPGTEIMFKDEVGGNFMLRYDEKSQEIEIGRARELDRQELEARWRTTRQKIERAAANEKTIFGRLKAVWEIASDTWKSDKDLRWTKFATRLTSTGVMSTLKTYLTFYGDFAVQEIYNKLNYMSNKQLEYYFEARDHIEELANEAFGIEDGLIGVGKLDKVTKNYDFTMKNGKKVNLTGTQLMYAYAQSLNPESAQMLFGSYLQKDGSFKDAQPYTYYFNKETFNSQLQDTIGQDTMDFVEKVIKFLSTSEYEKVNEVYETVNYVSLPKVEMFFPRLVVDKDGSIAETENIALGNDQNFFTQFNAQYQSFIKTRTAKVGKIGIEGSDFFGILDNYLKDSTRFRAFAEGTKDISAVFNEKSFKNALRMGYASGIVGEMISNSINPNQLNRGKSRGSKSVDRFLTLYVLGVLSFKAIQILKQGASFVMAFSEYNYNPNYKPKTYGGAIGKTLQDLFFFTVDAMKVYANINKEVKQAKEVSATFRSRDEEQNLFTLASGLPSQDLTKGAFKKLSQYGGEFTKIGDRLGVMGYWINYKRDIANGMSKAEALEKFNEYNETQQSRRIQDLTESQMNKTWFVRMAISFMSVGILYLNQVMQSMTRMMFKRGGKRDFSRENIRKLAMNLSLGNAMFFVAGNFLRLFGNDKDREEFLRELLVYSSGLYLLESSMIFFGSFLGLIKDIYFLEKRNPFASESVNPVLGLARNIGQYWGGDKVLTDKEDKIRLERVLKDLGLMSGFNFDPAFAAVRMGKSLYQDGNIDGRDLANFAGISKSALPEMWNSRDWLKWYDYDAWESSKDMEDKIDEMMKPYIKQEREAEEKFEEFLYRMLGKKSTLATPRKMREK